MPNVTDWLGASAACVAAVGTVGTLAHTARTNRRQVDNERRRQAGQVSLVMGKDEDKIFATCTNHSELPISAVSVYLSAPQFNRSDPVGEIERVLREKNSIERMRHLYSEDAPVLVPGDGYSLIVGPPEVGMDFSENLCDAEVFFTDASGITWRRTHQGKLELAPKPMADPRPKGVKATLVRWRRRAFRWPRSTKSYL